MGKFYVVMSVPNSGSEGKEKELGVKVVETARARCGFCSHVFGTCETVRDFSNNGPSRLETTEIQGMGDEERRAFLSGGGV